jgi:hypothetical protein
MMGVTHTCEANLSVIRCGVGSLQPTIKFEFHSLTTGQLCCNKWVPVFIINTEMVSVLFDGAMVVQ